MKNLFVLFLIVVLFISGCQPSETAIQTAMAQTQAALPTATPAPTAIPTPTVNPCSDRGWADITIYLHQFDQEARSAQAGISILAFLQQLENTKDKINAVSIDACTEHARQLIVEGLGNQIYAFQLIFTGGAKKDYEEVMVKGAFMIADARDELDGLGIHLNYPP